MLGRTFFPFLIGFAALAARAAGPELGTVVDNWPGRNVILGTQPTATVADYDAIQERYFQPGALSMFGVGEGFGAELAPRDRVAALQGKVWEMLLAEGAD